MKDCYKNTLKVKHACIGNIAHHRYRTQQEYIKPQLKS